MSKLYVYVRFSTQSQLWRRYALGLGIKNSQLGSEKNHILASNTRFCLHKHGRKMSWRLVKNRRFCCHHKGFEMLQKVTGCQLKFEANNGLKVVSGHETLFIRQATVLLLLIRRSANIIATYFRSVGDGMNGKYHFFSYLCLPEMHSGDCGLTSQCSIFATMQGKHN